MVCAKMEPWFESLERTIEAWKCKRELQERKCELQDARPNKLEMMENHTLLGSGCSVQGERFRNLATKEEPVESEGQWASSGEVRNIGINPVSVHFSMYLFSWNKIIEYLLRKSYLAEALAWLKKLGCILCHTMRHLKVTTILSKIEVNQLT